MKISVKINMKHCYFSDECLLVNGKNNFFSQMIIERVFCAFSVNIYRNEFYLCYQFYPKIKIQFFILKFINRIIPLVTYLNIAENKYTKKYRNKILPLIPQSVKSRFITERRIRQIKELRSRDNGKKQYCLH